VSGQIVNLNKARKVRARAERKQVAQENSIRFGRSKAEKTQEDTIRNRAEKDLNGKQRDT